MLSVCCMMMHTVSVEKKTKSEQIKCKNEADREMVHRWMRFLGKKDNGAMP